MGNRILIAGAGVMGTYYTRNIVNLRSSLSIEKIVVADIDADKCKTIKAEHGDQIEVIHAANTGAIASLIEQNDINGLIGATQTDSHLSVLKEALSVGSQRPQIQHILQEKPFGLFESSNDSDFDGVVSTIKKHDIRFGMDSILMYSDVYDTFASYILRNPDLIHQSTKCIYGKNRTKDTRPAHMGVFGTEGTHAIDISRRIGNEYLDLKFASGVIDQGFLTERDRDVPYACDALYQTESDAPVQIRMSLAFDQNYRQVGHVFKNARSETIEVTIHFDKRNDTGVSQDTFTAYNVDTHDIELHTSAPSDTKLKSALCAVFSDNGKSVYDIDQTIRLRSLLGQTMTQSTLERANGKPIVNSPKPFRFGR
jgi:predicted dehydrogenase